MLWPQHEEFHYVVWFLLLFNLSEPVGNLAVKSKFAISLLAKLHLQSHSSLENTFIDHIQRLTIN